MELETVKKQNRKVTIFAIILSFISIGLLIFGFSLVSSDKVVMLQSISNLSNKLDKSLDNNSSLFNKMASANDIGIRSNIKLNASDTNISLAFDYLENRVDKKSKLLFDVKVNNEDLLGLDLALANDKIYLYVDDITTKYYYTALEYSSFLSSLSSSDYDKIVALLKESVTDYIENEDIKKEKVTISYNGKDKKVNKLTYEITNKTVKDIATNFINSLKKDKSLLENISSYMNMTNEEIINSLDEILESLDSEEKETILKYHVYYYGFNKIVQYSLEDVESNAVLEYKIEDKETINFYEDEVNILSLEVEKNKKQYDFNGFILMEDSEKYSFSGNVLDNTLTIILDQEESSVKLVVTSTNEEKDSSFYSKENIEVYTIIDSQESKLGTLEIDSEYYFDQKVSIDLTNSVDVSQITEEDMVTIQNNLMNHPIYQLFNTITGSLDMSL